MDFYTVHLPPFTTYTNNEFNGTFHKIAKEICKNQNLECRFSTAPWKRIMNSIKEGKFDACYVVGKNKDREKWMYFSTPVAETEYGFFYVDNYQVKPTKLKDIENKVIVVHAKSNTEKQLRKLNKKFQNFKISVVNDVPMLLKMFANKRFGKNTLLYGNKDIYKAIFKQNNVNFVKYGFKDKPIHYRFGFSKKAVNIKEFEAFEKGLQHLKENGFLKKVLDQDDITFPLTNN